MTLICSRRVLFTAMIVTSSAACAPLGLNFGPPPPPAAAELHVVSADDSRTPLSGVGVIVYYRLHDDDAPPGAHRSIDTVARGVSDAQGVAVAPLSFTHEATARGQRWDWAEFIKIEADNPCFSGVGTTETMPHARILPSERLVTVHLPKMAIKGWYGENRLGLSSLDRSDDDALSHLKSEADLLGVRAVAIAWVRRAKASLELNSCDHYMPKTHAALERLQAALETPQQAR